MRLRSSSKGALSMVRLLLALLLTTGDFDGPAAIATAFTTAPSSHYYQRQNAFSSSTSVGTGTASFRRMATAAVAKTPAITPPHHGSSVSHFNGVKGASRATTMMLPGICGSNGDGGNVVMGEATSPWSHSPIRSFYLGGGGDGDGGGISSSSSASVRGYLEGGLYSDGGSSGPPRSGGLGRGGGGGGGDDGEGRGGDGGDDRQPIGGDLMALGAAQVMMAATDERSPHTAESTLRGGYRRRSSLFGRQSMQARRGTNSGGGGVELTATNVLLALNAIVYLFQMRYPGITRAGWKMAAAITQQGQWYRLFTPMVLHGSFTHLAVNSMSFSSVGPVVERTMGKAKFVAVYVLAGVAGNVLSCIVNPRTPSVGASGAIFGMVGAWAAFCVMNEAVLGRENSQRALRNVAQTVMINVVYGMSSSQIDNMGHLGGFLGGAVATLLIGPRFKRRINPFTGQPYIVDESFKLGLPRFGRKPRG